MPTGVVSPAPSEHPMQDEGRVAHSTDAVLAEAKFSKMLLGETERGPSAAPRAVPADPFGTVEGTGFGYYEVPNIRYDPKRLAAVVSRPPWIMRLGDAVKVHETTTTMHNFDQKLLSGKSIVGVVFPQPVLQGAGVDCEFRFVCGHSGYAGEQPKLQVFHAKLQRGQTFGTRTVYTWWAEPAYFNGDGTGPQEDKGNMTSNIMVPAGSWLNEAHPVRWPQSDDRNVLIFYF